MYLLLYPSRFWLVLIIIQRTSSRTWRGAHSVEKQYPLFLTAAHMHHVSGVYNPLTPFTPSCRLLFISSRPPQKSLPRCTLRNDRFFWKTLVQRSLCSSNSIPAEFCGKDGFSRSFYTGATVFYGAPTPLFVCPPSPGLVDSSF